MLTNFHVIDGARRIEVTLNNEQTFAADVVGKDPHFDLAILHINAPAEILRHCVVKGPITVDGASLTVVAKDAESFSVSLVQYTQEHTNLLRREPGDSVNLESDIIARYVDELLTERAAG